MADRYDDFERRLAADLRSYVDEGAGPMDVDAVVERASRPRAPLRTMIAAFGAATALVIAAVAIGLGYSALRGDQASRLPASSESASPSPSAESATPLPTVAPSASSTVVCATDPCPADLPVSAGEYGETQIEDVPLWTSPSGGEPVDVGLLAGDLVYVSDSQSVGDEGWYRVQVALRSVGTGEYVFGWLPGVIDGQPTLRPSGRYADVFDMCPTELPDGWRVVGLDPAARVLCGAGASLTLEGYLGERLPAEDPIFSGEPDWLANEATLVLWSAVGPAVTGFELRLHIDPRSGVAYSDAILSDPEGSRATLVHVTGHLNDPASASCRRSPRIDNFLPMTETEQVMWCRQQFVVEQIHVGEFAEADLTDMETCENEALGYRVSFPDAWYTNTAYEGAPACGLFNPGVFAVAPGRPASGVAITVGGVPGAFGHLDPILSNQEVTVAGRPARRLEVGGGYGPAAASPAWARQYQYIVSLTDAWDGPKLIATTSNGGPGDYETNRAVLDAMMESLVLLPAD